MNKYIEKMTTENAALHHQFLNSVEAWIQSVNSKPGRRRVKDTDAIKHPQQLLVNHRKSRELVGKWRQCVPISKWAQLYPGVDLPEEQGTEVLDGVATKVAYILKEGCKRYHYDIEDREGTERLHQTKVAELEDDDGEWEEQGMCAKKQKLWDASKAILEKAEAVKDITLAGPTSESGQPIGSADHGPGKDDDSEDDSQGSDDGDEEERVAAFALSLDPFNLAGKARLRKQ